MSRAVIVVEAALRSRSLITARFAAENRAAMSLRFQAHRSIRARKAATG